ncbi:PIN domain-containing protein [Streptomyces sp. S1A(2023)]
MSEFTSSSFTQGYEEFWRKPQDFVDAAIAASTVVLDTNAILNLYRMKPSARKEYFQVLQKIESRVWVPRQVADEFHRNRISTVDSHLNSLNDKSDKVVEAAESLKFALRDFFKLHSLADGRSSDYLQPLNEAVAEITTSVWREVEEYDLKPSDLLSDDPVLKRLSHIFEGKVGSGIPIDERKDATEEALRRGENETPPGYKDVKNRGEKGVGDYLIWREIIEYAKSTERDVLFVSTDMKEDWVRKQCGFSIGPRPELVREMRTSAGVGYHHIPLAVFLSRAAAALKVPVSQDTIDQVKGRPTSIENTGSAHLVQVFQQELDASERKLLEIRESVAFLHRWAINAEHDAAAMRDRLNHAVSSDSDAPDLIRDSADAEEYYQRRLREMEGARDLLSRAEREHFLIGERLQFARDMGEGDKRKKS